MRGNVLQVPIAGYAPPLEKVKNMLYDSQM